MPWGLVAEQQLDFWRQIYYINEKSFVMCQLP